MASKEPFAILFTEPPGHSNHYELKSESSKSCHYHAKHKTAPQRKVNQDEQAHQRDIGRLRPKTAASLVNLSIGLNLHLETGAEPCRALDRG
jgi:hypothetical protein